MREGIVSSSSQTCREHRVHTITTGHGLGVAEGGSGEGSKEDSGEAHGENDKRVLSGERHRAKRTVMECEGELQTEELELQVGHLLYTRTPWAGARPGGHAMIHRTQRAHGVTAIRAPSLHRLIVPGGRRLGFSAQLMAHRVLCAMGCGHEYIRTASSK